MHGMLGSRSSLSAVTLTVLASVSAPTEAHASPHSDKAVRTAHVVEARACAKPAVEVVGSSEAATFSLATCDGDAIPASVDRLSILARPAGTAKPKETSAPGHSPEIAPGIRRLDSRLAERIELVADHFRKEGPPLRIVLTSGLKGRRVGSYHASGRALDFHIDGVENDALVAFCKTLEDTGCGFYPNSTFIHLDVRDDGAGHVSWIDISRPGEPPKYVSKWPLPTEQPAERELAHGEAASEATKQADAPSSSGLPSLPAAADIAPLESNDRNETPATPRHHKHRRHRHKRATSTDHTI